jgi:hypothetical protein
MRPHRLLSRHLGGIAIGLIAMALRLGLLFAVMGAAGWIYLNLGSDWFYVFIFAIIAARLHFELRWIERNFDSGEAEGDNSGDNPFRKR